MTRLTFDPFLQRHIPPIRTWGDAPAILTPPATEIEVYAVLERYRVQKKYGVREGQAIMVGHVWRALEAGECAMIEAPTGTGKTIAALIPALVAAMADGSRIGISTAYRNLQDQVLTEIANVQRLLKLPFRYQIMKGASNYLCHDRLVQGVAELNPHSPIDERYCLFYLLAWTLRRTDADNVPTLDDVNFWLRQTFAVMAHVAAAVSAVSPSCHPKRCGDVNCALLRVTESAKSAHLLLINHDLWLADPDRLPSMRAIIVDEAHTLEDVATRASTKTVSRESLTALYDRLRDQYDPQGRAASPLGANQR